MPGKLENVVLELENDAAVFRRRNDACLFHNRGEFRRGNFHFVRDLLVENALPFRKRPFQQLSVKCNSRAGENNAVVIKQNFDFSFRIGKDAFRQLHSRLGYDSGNRLGIVQVSNDGNRNRPVRHAAGVRRDEVGCVVFDAEQNAAEYRARKEGFSRKISLGFRAAGGMNMVFGKKSGGWELGYEGSAGMFAKMPFFSRLFTLYPELDFDYRVFNFKSESDYSEDEAVITQMLFEIPVLFLFAPDNEGFFVGIGPDIGLKLSSKSKYKQEVDTGKKIEKDKRKNTLPTTGVLIGGAFDIGYAFTSHFSVDIRVVQYLTNLVNEKAVAETAIMGSKLYTFHTTLGISFAL